MEGVGPYPQYIGSYLGLYGIEDARDQLLCKSANQEIRHSCSEEYGGQVPGCNRSSYPFSMLLIRQLGRVVLLYFVYSVLN